MRVLLLRHAETAWTLTGQHTGRTELELTSAGEREASATAPLLRKIIGPEGLDALYVSPRKRARQTLELALGVSVEPRVSELLAELDYGAYEGLTPAQIHERAPGWSIWEDGCPEGESVADVGARADQFIRLLVERHFGQTVCAVAHGHLLRILSARFVGLEARQGSIFSIKTSSIAEVVRKDQSFVLSRWNLTLADVA
jgi:broad specificity phosphatase PhoE